MAQPRRSSPPLAEAKPISAHPASPPRDLVPRCLAMAFVIYGVVAVGLLALNMPPFQNPDEVNHFLRAAQIADGSVLGTRFSVMDPDGSTRLTSGAPDDPAVLAASAPFERLKSHPDQKVARSDWQPRVAWSQAREMADFWNTLMYPPVFYLPSAAGILIGRAADRSVLDSLFISRLLTGLAAVALGATAIALAEGAAIWIFAVLTLPMSLSQIASVSQDALLLACAALAGALVVRGLRHGGGLSRLQLVTLIVVLTLMAMARPPYAALSLMLLALPGSSWRLRIASTAAVLAGVAAWLTLMAATGWENQSYYAGVDPFAQAEWLWTNPLAVPRIAAATLTRYGEEYAVEFVGKLGWLDTGLPGEYHIAARVMLGLAAIAAMLGLTGSRVGAARCSAIALGALAAAVGVFAILYITNTPVGDSVVEAVQGRYFLPIALAATPLLPAIGRSRWASHYRRLVLVVAAFPAVSLAVTLHAVVLRYYLG